MADGSTPRLGLIKPEVGASKDTWGNKTNNNWDTLDANVAVLDEANEFTNDITVKKTTGEAAYNLSSASGFTRLYKIFTGAVLRWAFGANQIAETGANVGSSFIINRYDDSGNLLATAVSISRATGKTTLEALDVAGVISSGADLILATANSSGYIVRPDVAGKKSVIIAVAGGGALDEIILNATDVRGVVTPAFGDNDKTLATTEFVQSAVSRVPETYRDASYVLAASDAGKMILMNTSAGGDLTVTVPADASVNFPLYTRIDLLRWGGGNLTVVADAGVNIVSADAKLKLRASYSGATLWKQNTNLWALIGDLG